MQVALLRGGHIGPGGDDRSFKQVAGGVDVEAEERGGGVGLHANLADVVDVHGTRTTAWTS